MAGKNWQAGGRNSIPARAFACLLATAAPCGLALAASPASNFAPASYIGSLDPNEVWELLLAGVAILSLLVAIGLWTLSALRGAKRAIDDGIDAWAACRFDLEVANACYATKERKAGIAGFGAKT